MMNNIEEIFRLHKNDTGSVALQIILLRKKIKREWIHLKNNKKDVSTGRALEKKVAKEKKFFQYLKRYDSDIYERLKKELKVLKS
ncbi:30S ribosomal protein S15 [endosymbiont GvMRE of Glomus versiforme]|uniref:30S ribosomal protein S15 n=1 Tax=endosymbiont GvMRE of Glomus versiforme TaxID=2039283 RepID=UPI000EC0AC50|nr:30S ribosomal protein S15 [endosymbiont GvMRE of Glomus versiforme]RHZ35231.1 30S ribosomal protein S15 [endosymbiont GvMRE of Glomus versiforme]